MAYGRPRLARSGPPRSAAQLSPSTSGAGTGHGTEYLDEERDGGAVAPEAGQVQRRRLLQRLRVRVRLVLQQHLRGQHISTYCYGLHHQQQRQQVERAKTKRETFMAAMWPLKVA